MHHHLLPFIKRFFNPKSALSLIGCILATIACPAFVSADAGDFEGETQAASGKVEAAYPVSQQLILDGDLAEANRKLLAIFPEPHRTAAEMFILGNALFEIDRKLSYALHKSAAAADPGEPHALWEWAMEQHRAGEYAGALAAYQAYSKTNPKSAAPYALQADCLLRLHRTDEAIAAWRMSEEAPKGSIETMEDLVCAVHRDPAPFAQRDQLLSRAIKNHDATAAADLIAIDCAWPMDWWNAPANVPYLKHDAAAVSEALKLPADDVLGRAISCAAECAAAEDEADAVKAALQKYRLLTDADQTIPSHGGLLSVLIPAAMQAKAIDDVTLHEKVGPKVLALARKSHDPAIWNVAMFTANPDAHEQFIALEREAWKAAPDARFAAGVLFLKMESGKLSPADADLVAAEKQFPESGLIWRAAILAARQDGQLTRDLLATAARAEFTHFTSFVAPATVVNRPRSDYLRAYFALLLKMPAASQPAR